MSITLAIATYNRLPYVKKMLKSLECSVDVNKINVRIYDDCSTEYGVNELLTLAPYAFVHRNKENLKADLNMWDIYKDFLTTGDDILINANSDLIFRPGWLRMVLMYLPKTDGVLSLYNSSRHPEIQISGGGDGYKEKLRCSWCGFY